MSIIEKHLNVASKLYECRRTAKMLYKEEWPAKFAEYKAYIQAAMKKHNEDELKATLRLGNLVSDNGMAVMLLMAACVEIIEPEIPTNKTDIKS